MRNNKLHALTALICLAHVPVIPKDGRDADGYHLDHVHNQDMHVDVNHVYNAVV